VQELSLDGDTSCLYYAARALTRLQAMYGAAPRVLGKGAGAAAVKAMMTRMRRELGADAPPVGEWHRDAVVAAGSAGGRRLCCARPHALAARPNRGAQLAPDPVCMAAE
jgi:hypothetical protein